MKQDRLVTGEFYHLFNRANSQKDKLFFQTRNYHYFLQKWDDYLSDIFEVWAYCLIPNHFHFLVKMKEVRHESAIESWRKFIISYTQSINKQQLRRGSLFQEHPKRIQIQSEKHLFALIHYIHNNPVHHGLTSRIEDWNFSSYLAVLSKATTKIERNQVLKLFANVEEFKAFHQQTTSQDDISYCLVE